MRGDKIIILMGIATLNAMTVYVLYRIGTVFYSLHYYSTWLEYLIIIGFFCAELFIVANGIMYFMNILNSLFYFNRIEKIFHPLRRTPSVIVFVPMKNEPLEVIEKTFLACSYIMYPRHKVVVIDSSDAPGYPRQVEMLAKSYGLDYFATPFPRHGAKAGALNEAMKVHKAEFYVIFDADYRPSRDCLKVLVPLIDSDPSLAFVQTPQFYGNHENLPVSRVAQIQQSVFYEYISEAKSVHNGMFLCGTNLIIRASALADVGGWDEWSITEDFSTSIQLIVKGWKNKYFNFIVGVGDGPLNLRQYFIQQYRWSRGTFESFFTNFIGIWGIKTPMSLWQRIELSLSGIYFCVGLVWMLLICMPILYIFFRIPSYTSDPLLFTLAYAPYAVLSFSFFAVSMRYRYVAIKDLLRAQSLTMITLPIYIKALFDTIVRKKATFVSVKKTAHTTDIPHAMLWFQYLIIALNWLAVLYGLYFYPEASNKTALMSNIFWALFHGIFMLYFIGTIYFHDSQKKAQ